MIRDYQAYIFDFDGTLADSRTNIANSLNEAFSLNGYEPVPVEKIHPIIGKRTLEQNFFEFYPDMPETLVPKLVLDYRAHQLGCMKQELTLFPHVVDVLTELKRRGKFLAILTTKITPQITLMLEVLTIKHLFDFIYGADLPHGRKPERTCLEYILTQFPTPVSKHDAVMVGDTDVDINTGVNAGVDTVGVSFGIDSRTTLQSAGATYIIDSFSELLV